MTQVTLIHISDSHLSRTRAYFYKNWLAVKAYIEATQPDLVVHTGDHLLDDPNDIDDLRFGHEQLQRLTVPWRALPGDHDIGGGMPHPRTRPDVPWLEHYGVTEARLAYYLDLFGADHWVEQLGAWTLIGINDLIFGSDFAAEAIQWQFIEAQFAAAQGRPIALFTHKPLCLASLADDAPIFDAVPVEGRRRLRALMSDANVRLLCSGHIHVYRTWQTDGKTLVTAPTLMRGQDDWHSARGSNVNGIVQYTFDGDAVEFRLVQPDGLERPELPRGRRMDWPLLHAETLDHD